MLKQGITSGLMHGVALRRLFSANVTFVYSIGLQVFSSVR